MGHALHIIIFFVLFNHSVIKSVYGFLISLYNLFIWKVLPLEARNGEHSISTNETEIYGILITSLTWTWRNKHEYVFCNTIDLVTLVSISV